MIRVDGLTKRYGRRTAVDGLGFAVEPGQICALLGPNGAGKTSTMRVLVGLSRPTAGTVAILGEPVGLGAGVLRRVGVLIDGPAFVPHLTRRWRWPGSATTSGAGCGAIRWACGSGSCSRRP
jgi:ABC-type multidrug transport system ATPase subunit